MGSRSLEGRVAIITGAGRGLGRANALLMAAEGASIVVNDYGVTTAGHDPRHDVADQVVQEIQAAGGKAVADYGDVGQPQVCTRLIETAMDHFGGLDILVNNAAIVDFGMLIDIEDAEFDRTVQVGLHSAFYLTKRAGRIFREKGYGRIVNTSSDAAGGYPLEGHYAVAKAGLLSLTYTTAREMSQWGVTCNAIKPRAWTRIPIDAELDKKAEEDAKSADPRVNSFSWKINVIKNQLPEHVAPLVAYLSSEQSAGVSGCVFTCAGPWISLNRTQQVRTIFAENYWTIDGIAKLLPEALTAGMTVPDMLDASEGAEFYSV